MPTLIIGLGNPLVTDDSVGLRVAAELRSRLAGRADVEVTEDYWGGLRLMEQMVGYDCAIVIDAICSAPRRARSITWPPATFLPNAAPRRTT